MPLAGVTPTAHTGHRVASQGSSGGRPTGATPSACRLTPDGRTWTGIATSVGATVESAQRHARRCGPFPPSPREFSGSAS